MIDSGTGNVLHIISSVFRFCDSYYIQVCFVLAITYEEHAGGVKNAWSSRGVVHSLKQFLSLSWWIQKRWHQRQPQFFRCSKTYILGQKSYKAMASHNPTRIQNVAIDNSPKKSTAVRPFVNRPVAMCVSNWRPYGGWLDLAREMRWLLLPGSARESPKMKSAGTSGALPAVVNVAEENPAIIGTKAPNQTTHCISCLLIALVMAISLEAIKSK